MKDLVSAVGCGCSLLLLFGWLFLTGNWHLFVIELIESVICVGWS